MLGSAWGCLTKKWWKELGPQNGTCVDVVVFFVYEWQSPAAQRICVLHVVGHVHPNALVCGIFWWNQVKGHLLPATGFFCQVSIQSILFTISLPTISYDWIYILAVSWIYHFCQQVWGKCGWQRWPISRVCMGLPSLPLKARREKPSGSGAQSFRLAGKCKRSKFRHLWC